MKKGRIETGGWGEPIAWGRRKVGWGGAASAHLQEGDDHGEPRGGNRPWGGEGG
jgi:hypothetical protein